MARITLAGDGPSFDAQPGETVLDAARRCGIELPHDCRSGGCGSCRAQVLEGQVRYEEMPFALSEEQALAGEALLCQAHALGDLLIAPCAGVALPPPRRVAGRIRARRALAPQVTGLELDLEVDALDYQPGQYVKLLLPDGAGRNFSMASPPRGRSIELHIRHIPGGRFTDGVLPQMQAGDRIEVEIPLGSFCYHPLDDRELVMVATGTGIAPIKAILESLADEPGCPPVALYWGVRTEADLYLAASLSALADRFDEFRFTPVLSRPSAAWAGRRGHVQDAVAQDHADLSNHALYLCGSPAMIEQARARFLRLGASSGRLYADAFSFQDPQPVPLHQ